MIARYLLTLPTSGKKPMTIAEEHYYGRWWTDRLTGKALHAVTPAILEQAWLTSPRSTTRLKPSCTILSSSVMSSDGPSEEG